MPENEVELIKQAQAGSKAAFAALYDCHQSAVFTYLYYRAPDQATAEELTAQVFVRMVEKINQYCPQDKPILAWLYTIARHILADYYRQEKHAILLPLDDTLTSDLNPAHIVDRGLATDCLQQAMQHLTEEQKLVLIGKFVEERSNQGVADLLDKSEGAVKSLQHRALAALRRAIEREGCYE